MTPPSNYRKIINDNLAELYRENPASIANRLEADHQKNRIVFFAFGEPCEITPAGVRLGHGPDRLELDDARGIIISLYARHASGEPCRPEKFRAYKEFKDTMPYAAAFHARTEQALVAHSRRIVKNQTLLTEKLDGGRVPAELAGDCAFTVRPLPKILLAYILYEADEDFPAAVTCLYSANADAFLPPDALADLGEYTSKKIISMVTGGP